MNEEKLKIAVFIDFDNIQIGVRSTLNRDFDLALVLEALKERGEVVTKIAYGNWKRAGELTRTLTQNAVLMVQRDLTPRGDKNGADINLALDALEMAINHPHINAFVVVGGDSDFIALVEKLKQYNKAVFVVGGRSFTSSILQRNCREFLAYENLVEATSPAERRRDDSTRRRAVYTLERAVPLVYRGLKVLADREVQAQLGLLKSTLIQLDSTFNERDYGASSFRVFMQKMAEAGLVNLRQQGNSFVVEPLEREPVAASEAAASEGEARPEGMEEESDQAPAAPPRYESAPAAAVAPSRPPEEALDLLQRILAPLQGTNPRPLYLRNVKQLLRAEEPNFDEQQFGFGSIVDLLRAGQNQNWLRLQRDRRGALRVFIPPSGNAAPASAAPGNAASAEEGSGEARDIGNRAEPGAEAPALDGDQQPVFQGELEARAMEGNGNIAESPAAAAAVAEVDPEDSQIAVLGYYSGVHGEQTEEAPLSLAAAVADGGGRKKRGGRKPKGEGGAGPRRRKPKH